MGGFSELNWTPKESSQPLKYCTATTRNCVNSNCNARLRWASRSNQKSGSSQTNLAHRIPKNLQLDIFKLKGVLLSDKQNICNSCYEKATTLQGVAAMEFKSKAITTTLIKPIWNLLQASEAHGFKMYRQEKQSYNSKQRRSGARLNIDGLESREVYDSAGLYMDELESMHKTANERKPDTLAAITIMQLFITLTISWNAVKYRFGKVLFCFSSIGALTYITDKVVDLLYCYFTPTSIGHPAWTQKRIEEECPKFVKILHPKENVGGTVDCTYIYRQKSSNNYQLQKATYCAFKKQHLLKIQTITSCSGKYILIHGPFCADGQNHDSKIWDSIICDEKDDFHKIFTKPATFIGDRAYDNCAPMEKYKFRTPNTLKQVGDSNTKRLNKSRQNNLTRNIVERCYSKVKLDDTLGGKHSGMYAPSKIYKIFVIRAAIHNEFGAPMYTDESYKRMEENSRRIMDRQDVDNDIMDIEAQESGWQTKPVSYFLNRGTVCKNYFDLDDLSLYGTSKKLLDCCGYYLHHAPYVKYMAHKDYPDTIRVDGLVSKNSRNDTEPKRYTVYHRFAAKFMDSISYCTGSVGARTAGACVHVITSLYELYHRLNGISTPLPRNIISTKYYKQCTDLANWKQMVQSKGSASVDVDADVKVDEDSDDNSESITDEDGDENMSNEMEWFLNAKLDDFEDLYDQEMEGNDICHDFSWMQDFDIDMSRYVDKYDMDNDQNFIPPMHLNTQTTGLINNQFCCYINGILQLIYSIDSLRESYIKYNECFQMNTLANILGLQFMAMKTMDASKAKAININRIVKKLKSIDPNFDWERTQSDACEFLSRIFFDKLYDESGVMAAINGFKFHLNEMLMIESDPIITTQEAGSRPRSILRGLLPDVLPVLNVGLLHGSLQENIRNYISDVPYFMSGSPINPNSNYQTAAVCNNCIRRLPDIFLIRLKRFNEDNSKNSQRVTFPLELNMNHLVLNEFDSTAMSELNDKYPHYDGTGSYIYDLKSFVIHSGTTRGGHYYTLVRLDEETTYVCNDASIQSVTDSEYQKYFGGRDCAYIFAYIRRGTANKYVFTQDVEEQNCDSVESVESVESPTKNRGKKRKASKTDNEVDDMTTNLSCFSIVKRRKMN